jgi:hypothetical protein
MATKGKFPCKAYMLSSSYSLRQVTAVKQGWFAEHVRLDSGHTVPASALFATKSEAIAAGEKSLAQRRARLAKSVANIEKYAANLAKAEADNG